MSTEPVPAAPVPTGPLRAELLRTASLRSARLDLVPLRVEHAGEMADVLSDPNLHTFIGGSPATAQALRSRYARLVAGSPDPSVVWCNWVLRRRRDPCLVGTVQATVTGEGLAEIAWVVGTPWQGRGYASEAAAALVAGLRAHSVRTVVAHVHPDHLASAAVAAAAGLSPTDEEQDGEIRWRLSLTPDPDAVGPPHG